MQQSFQKEIYERCVKELSSHAYFLVGNLDICKNLVTDLQNENHMRVNSMDSLYIETPMFSIDDARELRSWISTSPIEGGKKIAIIYMDAVTEEAQNALLKSLEDTPKDTHVFIIKNNTSKILPTLLSRVTLIEFRQMESSNEDSLNFLKMNIPKRLDYVSHMIKNHKEEGDKKEIMEFLVGIESILSATDDVFLKEQAMFVLKSRDTLSDSGSPVKTILESIALTLPMM